MLQRAPYMTAEALGIDPNEHQALVAVLGKLERGELCHVPNSLDAFDEFGDACGFNMRNWHCGSVACIGGWAEWLGNLKFNQITMPLELDKLFYPEYEEEKWSSITPDQAAQALRNYLTHGEARWSEVLAP